MKFSDESHISVVVTSCGRFDLLKLTLESFDRFNTADIHSVFITEDSGDEAVHAAIPAHWRERTRVFVNRPRLGQLASIDLAYGEVRTPYVFHLEDDWQFYREGFIEDSLRLLQADPKLLQVWLRSYAHDLQIHAAWHKRSARLLDAGVPHYRLVSERAEWQGFSLNPGLRRLADYRTVSPFAAYDKEKEIAAQYAQRGFHAVMLEADAVLHTGWDAHVVKPEDVKRKRKRRAMQYAVLALALALAAVFGLGVWIG